MIRDNRADMLEAAITTPKDFFLSLEIGLLSNAKEHASKRWMSSNAFVTTPVGFVRRSSIGVIVRGALAGIGVLSGHCSTTKESAHDMTMMIRLMVSDK